MMFRYLEDLVHELLIDVKVNLVDGLCIHSTGSHWYAKKQVYNWRKCREMCRKRSKCYNIDFKIFL